MKYLIASVFVSCLAFENAQDDTIHISEPIELPDYEMVKSPEEEWGTYVEPSDAQYPGGEMAMFQFVQENFVFDDIDSLLEMGWDVWTVYVRFKVKTNGDLADFECLRGHDLMCNAAIEMFRKMPCWTPSYFKGEAVETTYVFPIKINYR